MCLMFCFMQASNNYLKQMYLKVEFSSFLFVDRCGVVLEDGGKGVTKRDDDVATECLCWPYYKITNG